jgi:Biotin carboxylase, N-terminal domain
MTELPNADWPRAQLHRVVDRAWLGFRQRRNWPLRYRRCAVGTTRSAEPSDNGREEIRRSNLPGRAQRRSQKWPGRFLIELTKWGFGHRELMASVNLSLAASTSTPVDESGLTPTIPKQGTNVELREEIMCRPSSTFASIHWSPIVSTDPGECNWQFTQSRPPIIRTVRRIGVRSVAFDSAADRHALHVGQVEATISIGLRRLRRVISRFRVCKSRENPGVRRFIPATDLSATNAKFAEAYAEHGILPIGPNPRQMRDFGLKHTAAAIPFEEIRCRHIK